MFPSNLDAILTLEAGALGAAILDSTARQARILAEFVREDDWVSPLSRAVFKAIRQLVSRDVLPLDYASIIAEMMEQGTFQSYTNGYSLISSLGEGVVLARPMTRRIHDLRAMWNQRKEIHSKLGSAT